MAKVLVTGCSSGIGRALAISLTARGHDVIATARRSQSLDDLHVFCRMQLDVTDRCSVTVAIEHAGEIDCLINNAGVGLWGPVERNTPAQVERVFDTNVLGALWMSQAVLPQMRARGTGHIIQISSGAARRPQPMVGIYAASKAALEAFSMAMRLELRGTGIAVAVVGMGAINSDIDKNRIVDPALGSAYEDMATRMMARTRKLRFHALSPRRVAEVVSDVLDNPNPPFRNYVDKEYAESLTAMAALSDEAFEAQVLSDLPTAE